MGCVRQRTYNPGTLTLPQTKPHAVHMPFELHHKTLSKSHLFIIIVYVNLYVRSQPLIGPLPERYARQRAYRSFIARSQSIPLVATVSQQGVELTSAIMLVLSVVGVLMAMTRNAYSRQLPARSEVFRYAWIGIIVNY